MSQAGSLEGSVFFPTQLVLSLTFVDIINIQVSFILLTVNFYRERVLSTWIHFIV